MNGVVDRVGFGFGFIATQGERFFAHASEMPPDEVGRRYLLPGEQVEFDSAPGNAAHRLAVKIRLLNAREPVDVDSYFEEGEVQHVGKRGEFCFVLRPFGGVAFLHWNEVAEHTSKTIIGVEFKPGQQLALPAWPATQWR